MKRLLQLLNIILTIIMVICELAEFLAIPAILVVIGLFNDLPWQYYAISIGGYIIFWLLMEMVARFVFKLLDKKYTPRIEKQLEKILDRFASPK